MDQEKSAAMRHDMDANWMVRKTRTQATRYERRRADEMTHFPDCGPMMFAGRRRACAEDRDTVFGRCAEAALE